MHIHVEAMLESEIRRKFGPLRAAVVYACTVQQKIDQSLGSRTPP